MPEPAPLSSLIGRLGRPAGPGLGARLARLTARAPRDPATVAVYLLQQGDAGPVKIGSTASLRQRLSALQTASPVPLRVLALLPGGQDEERALHARFTEHRLRGEWYEPAAEILDFARGCP